MSALSDYLSERQRIDGLSVREFARRCDISPTTAQRLLSGTSEPDRGTLEKVAARLPAPLNRLLELAGEVRPEPFILPSWADRLDARERRTVIQVVRQIAESGGKIAAPDGEVPDEDLAVPTRLTAGTAPRERSRVLKAVRRRPVGTDSDDE